MFNIFRACPITIIIFKMSAMLGWERTIYTLSSEGPSPTILTYKDKGEKKKTVEDENGASSLGP